MYLESLNLYLENSCSFCIKTLSPDSPPHFCNFYSLSKNYPHVVTWTISETTTLYIQSYSCFFYQCWVCLCVFVCVVFLFQVLQIVTGMYERITQCNRVLKWFTFIVSYRPYIFTWWNQVQTRKMINCKT